MKNDLPISPNKKFKYSITFESWDEDSLEIGQTDVRGYIEQDETDTIGGILIEANITYGIYMPFSFGRWESTYPDEDADYYEKGIRKFYFLEITNEDGTQISDEESDFITFLLSDGRYELNKFRDYAVGGIVIGSIVLGVGALITYFYFKGKNPSENKNLKSSSGRAKSVTHTINGVDKKFPIKDAWRKEHKIENKQQKFEVPQGDRKPVKYEMGGDASEYYHEVEYGEGGVARAKDVIMNKIGFNEETADYFVGLSEKFAIWLADSILKYYLKHRNLTKEKCLNIVSKGGINADYGGAIREILDWLQHPVTPKQDFRNLTFDEALEKAREWHQELQVLGGDIDFTEPETNTIIKTYPKNSDGIEYYWAFIPSNYCDLESSRMGHCGRTGYGNNLISLRSVKQYGTGHTINDSHITIAYGVNDGIFYQIKGKKNNKPAEKYFSYVFDLIKTFITDNNVFIPSKNDTVFAFNGFGSEYGAEEDYGFEDMTKEQLRELYDLKPNVFNDTKSILAIYDAGIITDEEIQKEYDVNSPNSIFSSFGNQMKLYDRGIILNKPSTIIEYQKSCEEVKDLLRLDGGMRDSIIEDVLSGDVYDYLGGWDYYYENTNDLVDNLNKKNREKVIDEIVRLTGLEKSLVTENGIEYYLNGEDEVFSKDEFENITRSLASAQISADENDYVNHIYKELQSSLEELGIVESLNSDGVTMTIDLSNLMSDEDISNNMETYEFSDLGDLFHSEIERPYGGAIDKPRFSIDDRYTPYGSSEDFNEYVFDSDLEEGYSKGGSLRPKKINKNKKTKIKNMKPNQRKFADGGDLGVSKEDYFNVVKNWVYFTFNYPMGFVKDAFDSTHLEEKFSSSYERYGSVGVLMSFWANLDDNNRRIMSSRIKNNYFSSSDDKSKLLTISDDDYAKIISHWNMFCFNFPYRFIENVYGDNTSHFEMKWVRAYESASSTGAVNKFFTEMSSNNQMLLTDWVYDNYKGSKFADGGEAGEKSTKNIRKKRPKNRQPKMVRQYFKDEAYDYADGGEVSVYNLLKGDKIKTRKGDIETIERKIESGYFTKESEYSHSFESIDFIERPNRRMADGGGVDLDYSDILNVLKTKIDDSIDEMPMDYENASDFTGIEVEHESRDGFIPYTDGGYQAVWFEYLDGMWSAGKSLPTKPLNDEMNRQIDYNLDTAKESFVDEYPEIVEELGIENIDYNSLYEAGYGEEAETLSSAEMEMMGEDTIMMQVSAFYYTPENSRAVDGKHTIRLFGDVNLESPYHRAGNLDDSYEFEFTFDSIDVLETEMAIGIAKILSWFNGDMYNDSDAEMKVRRMADGGEASKGLTKDEILSKYKGKYIDLFVGENGKHIVKGVSNTPKSRYLLAEEWYEDLYAEGENDIIVIHTSMKPELFIKKHKLTNYNFEIDETDYEDFHRINFETYPKNQNFLKDKSIIEFYYEPKEAYAEGGAVDGGSIDLSTKEKSEMYSWVDNFLKKYSGDDNLSQSLDMYVEFSKKFNKSKEETHDIIDNGWAKSRGYAGGGSVKGIKNKAEKLLEESIGYRWKNTDMGSGWLFKLESPLNRSVFNLLEEHLYLDEFSPDNMGIEDYDDLSKEEQDYYYEEWKEELFQSTFEAFKEKCKKHLDTFIEYLQRDSDDDFAGGGEIQDWMEEALASLIEETGNESLDITMVSNSGNEFFAGNDMEEYRVFKSEDDAELTAEDEVREMLEDSPENFNQDFIINYIDGGNFFEDSLDETNRSYAEDITSESHKKYANCLIAEMVEYGLLDEDDAESDNADELAEERIEDLVNLMTQEQMNQGNNGFDYFVNNFGQEKTMQMVITNNLIDIFKASKDAVQTDGIGHFLSSYDGETLYLSDGYVAYRNN